MEVMKKGLDPVWIFGPIGGTALATTMNGLTKQEWDTFIGEGKSSPNYYF